jgi:DNA-directed RNA polymerase specialized sigma24 family protein
VYVPRRKLRPIDRQVQDKLANLSPAARLQLTQFAKRGAQRLAFAGEPIAADEHEHIVHDAIIDTLYGVVACDQRIEIEQHLYNVVRRRISNRIRRARKQVHVSLDASTGNGNTPEIASRDGAPEASLGRAQVTHQLYRTVRERVVGDTALLSILDAYKAEVSQRRAVMAMTGWACRNSLTRGVGSIASSLRFRPSSGAPRSRRCGIHRSRRAAPDEDNAEHRGELALDHCRRRVSGRHPNSSA